MWRTTTQVMIVVIAVLTCVYDLIAYLLGGNEATISKVALDASQENNLVTVVVCLLVGVLIGHLFVPQREE